ncbi:hypothetical protein PF011_g31259 [Phytophthora fragariae]|uniref:Uncharacterized protein n=1 Tax=Phytophthora fragariae TaxID=53985 RepID=A0A6A3GEI9_9STRA|nr:hypothetical protein PF011_g31259 [Phytophthora fragariae]
MCGSAAVVVVAATPERILSAPYRRTRSARVERSRCRVTGYIRHDRLGHVRHIRHVCGTFNARESDVRCTRTSTRPQVPPSCDLASAAM